MTILLESRDLTVVDYVCAAQPTDPPFAEVHERYSLSFVRRGSFGCTARGRRHELMVGGYFVGGPGDEFVCTHDHHHGGDECLSFQMSAGLIDEIGADRQVWSRVSAPPVASLVAVGALAQATAVGATDLSMAEIGLRLPFLVLYVDPANRYVIFGENSRKLGWIYARETTLSDADYQAAFARLATLGYDPREFRKIIQTPDQIGQPGFWSDGVR